MFNFNFTKRVVLTACFISFVYAKPIGLRSGVGNVDLVELESRPGPPEGFVDTGPADPTSMMRMRASLASSNISGLEAELYAVSDPTSARYGQHLSKSQVEEFVKPSPSTITAVTQWLASHNISSKSLTPASDAIEFNIPIRQANEIFNADYRVLTHSQTGQQSLVTMSYSIPSNLKGQLNFVHPGTTVSSPFAHLPATSSEVTLTTSTASSTSVSISISEAAAANSSIPQSCDTSITPSCLQQLYGLPTALENQPGNLLGVSAFQFQSANKVDLESFLTRFRPDLKGQSFETVAVDGGKDFQFPKLAGIEANLDIQYTVGVASGANVTFLPVGFANGTNIADQFINLMDFLIAQDEVPTVLTTSYGENENMVSPALANQLCNAIMQLGARGTSVLFASGDGGVAGSHGVQCTTFVPTFPAGCPFLTAVGSTQGITETAANFSSGGFSNIFPQPSYQTSQVSTYLTTLAASSTPNTGLFNATGRAFPDVSAQGVNFEIFARGKGALVSGTSASSPTFASVISLLNGELIAGGKSPLGFLNPMLYQNAAALNDVTTGDNPGCGTQGFPAAAGWDAVTGLGTPNFAKLRTAAGL